MRRYFAVLVVIAAGVVGLAGQQPNPSWNGVYSDAQAKRGAPLYAGNCVACHGANLGGGDRAPALIGATFNSKWSGKPIAELLDYIHTVMPLHSPGSLSWQQSADILGFMLQQGKFTPGQTELRSAAAPMAASPVHKPTESTARVDGFYTAEQASRGKAAFNRNCAFCHTVDPTSFTIDDRDHSALPRTFGGHFVGRAYHGHLLYPSAYHLYRKLESMPAFNTKGISAQMRADILAYILQANGLPAGSEELTADTSLMKSMMLNEPGFERLFNGKDFTGINFVIGPNCLRQPDGCGKTEPGDVIRVEAGEIRCVCNVHGYFYWDKKYQNFTFRFEQRFERPADWDDGDQLYFGGTGALIFIQEPQRVFPKSIEIEGRYYDFGEPFAIFGKAKYTYDHDARLRAGKPVGQWDAIEIASKNGEVRTTINGVLISTITEHDYQPGQLGMQIEGAPVAWRNLRVRVD